jgi:hypothetical protein
MLTKSRPWTVTVNADAGTGYGPPPTSGERSR